MKNFARTVGVVALAATALAVPVTVTADSPLADVVQTQFSVEWQLHSVEMATALSLAGPDDMSLRLEFSAGESPYLEIFDRQGESLPDGRYKWELMTVPVLDRSSRDARDEARSGGTEAAHLARYESGRGPADGSMASGSFVIRGGAIVDSAAEESPASGPVDELRQASRPEGELAMRDQLILDDLIVDGSACIGTDCVNGESFGFDVVRLKENNLRINFEDTSQGIFPTNDWTLMVNDSSANGASHFSLIDVDAGQTPFVVEAGTRAHTLYLRSGGRVGIGTSLPGEELHIRGGNTPALRLEQDGSAGFAPQTWDVGGNESNFFVRNYTSTERLPFRILAAAPSNSILVNSIGDVGVGTHLPDAALHIRRESGKTEVHVEAADPSPALRTLFTIENNGGTQMDFIDNDLGRTWFFRTAGNNFVIDSDQSPSVEMRLRGDGGNNTSKLEIGGTIEVFGSGGGTVPDYVFADDYPLMPLAELERFIAENQHLPSVPSAGEIEAKGSYNMNQMQWKLLEKVEELTLYTLEQERTIRRMADENSALEARQEVLEATLQELSARLDASQ